MIDSAPLVRRGHPTLSAALLVGLCWACSAVPIATSGSVPSTPARIPSASPPSTAGRDSSRVLGPVADEATSPSDHAQASRDEAVCSAPELVETLPLRDPPRSFSVAGYRMRHLDLHREIAGTERRHCLEVAWPPGARNSAGAPCHVADNIDEAWLRAIANTLARVPWSHVLLLERVVIDDRPVEHGIAPFDRDRTDDARDGHTLWLHEHVFRDPNHYARGNYGRYWSYHVNVDDTTIDGAPAEHDLFSPVLLHELGHLVMYHLVNVGRTGSETAAVPACATTCRDDGSCADRRPTEREQGCVSPYCGPIRLPGSSENWAEQYRFYYQSSVTREIVLKAFGCAAQLTELDQAGGAGNAPWERGLPDLLPFHPSRWSSCGERPCKGY